jgi:hypothetical protein
VGFIDVSGGKIEKGFVFSIRITNFLHYFSTKSKIIQNMKNRDIVHARQEVKIYKEYYQPSLNLWRFTKCIIGVLFFGSSTVANHPITKKRIK